MNPEASKGLMLLLSGVLFACEKSNTCRIKSFDRIGFDFAEKHPITVLITRKEGNEILPSKCCVRCPKSFVKKELYKKKEGQVRKEKKILKNDGSFSQDAETPGAGQETVAQLEPPRHGDRDSRGRQGAGSADSDCAC